MSPNACQEAVRRWLSFRGFLTMPGPRQCLRIQHRRGLGSINVKPGRGKTSGPVEGARLVYPSV